MKKILVGFDGSEGSEQALNRAMMLLDEFGEVLPGEFREAAGDSAEEFPIGTRRAKLVEIQEDGSGLGVLRHSATLPEAASAGCSRAERRAW